MRKMKEKLFSKQNILCALATIIIVGSYAVQRIVEIKVTPDKNLVLIVSLIYMLLLAVVFYLISRSNNAFFGILAALLGYKMMPPAVSYLSATVDGDTLYFLVRKAAALVFVLIIYKLYKSQPEPHEIRSLPLLTILLSVPFFNNIAIVTTKYLMYKTGDMLYCYFAQFALYTAAVLVVLVIAYNSCYSSLRFTAYFEFAALSINVLRVLCKICYFAINHEHISKSLYVWIAIYVVLFAVFAIAIKVKEKQIAKE
jgi:hypothetical protein